MSVSAGAEGAVPTLPAEIIGWIEDATGASVTSARRVPGGNSRQAWFIDVDAPATGPATGQLFLRYDPQAHNDSGLFMSLPQEAAIFKALHGTGVAVPRILAVHPTRQAVLAERVDGDTWFYRISDPAEQVRVAQDFIRNLAALHRLDPQRLALVDVLGPVRSAAEHTTEELRQIRRRATDLRGGIDPLIGAALDWLDDHVPHYDGPTVLVQGDTGPGNFMYRDGKVTAVVDWELAHFGDPMDDIAWLSLRTVQDTFTDLPDRLAEYEQLSGITIDEQRVWYYRLMAEVRLAGQLTTSNGDRLTRAAADGRDAGNVLIYGLLHRRLLLEAFGHAAGFELPEPDLAATTTSPNDDAYSATLQMLRNVSQRPGDALSSQWVKSIARLVKYLRAADADGPRLQHDELAELSALLGNDCRDIAAGRAELDRAARDGVVDTSTYVAQLWRRSQRDNWLGREASGVLRERSWPPVRRGEAAT